MGCFGFPGLSPTAWLGHLKTCWLCHPGTS
uniref:Uncharacterized protein n=1 Tax=Anguilla anguilla TaxID=7936 RepID=A0A0E9QW00_ANGAN